MRKVIGFLLALGLVLVFFAPAPAADKTVEREVEGFGITENEVAKFKKVPEVLAISADLGENKQILKIQTPKGSEIISEIQEILKNSRIYDLKIKEPTLEDAYLRLIEGGAK
jgi:hypothetical protein